MNALGSMVQIDEGKIQAHLDQVVRSTVEETLNALLDAEADQLYGARRYERSEGGKDISLRSVSVRLSSEVTLAGIALTPIGFQSFGGTAKWHGD